MRSAPQWIAKMTWWSFLWVEAVAALITFSAIADVMLGLGWGYDWKAVLIGFGIMAWGGVIWLICRALFRVFGASDGTS